MKKPLKIYLADLTYNTVTIANDTFPLNVGYIGSYCISKFGEDVDVTLFKYIEDLENAIHDDPPDVLGMSNYCWNHNIDLEMFRLLSKINPYALKIWGGPNFPIDLESQEKFMKKYPEVDFYVPIEGEIGFSNIIKQMLKIFSKEEVRDKILTEPVEGCISRKKDGTLQFSNPVYRIKNLDEIPSPYLTGLLDRFFDGKLSPMFQSNRGCPFDCSFCVDGSDNVKQVNSFSIERVTSELQYMGEHVTENIHSMYISDLNFGMIPRDLEICKVISDIQNKYGFPKNINSTTGKNNKERIVEAIKTLDGSLRLLMSVQSTDEHVLANIKRQNISVDTMLGLAPTIKESGLNTYSEVILGLPGESYDSHIKTIRDLVRAKLDGILVYTCMMLDGAEMNTPEQREKWGLKTKFRILVKDFAKLQNGKNVLETEEVVVASNTLTFDEYVELRSLAFILWMSNLGIIYDALLKFLRENDVDVFELFHRTLKLEKDASQNIQRVLSHFRESTINELWDSPEEIISHYQNEEEYQKLVSSQAGMNVILYHHALVMSQHLNEWTDFTTKIAYELLKEKGLSGETFEKQFLDITNHCKGVSLNILGDDRQDSNPSFTFHYNIKKWLDDANNSSLHNFKFSSPHEIIFRLSDEQVKVVQDGLDKYGTSIIGISRILDDIPAHLIYRQPVVVNEITDMISNKS